MEDVLTDVHDWMMLIHVFSNWLLTNGLMDIAVYRDVCDFIEMFGTG